MKECYVRFSEPNPAGKSYNYRDNHWERGISVYKAAYNANVGHYYLQATDASCTLQTFATCICHVMHFGHPIYEVDGTLLPEKGTEGEPLLANFRIIRELTINKDGHIHRKR